MKTEELKQKNTNWKIEMANHTDKNVTKRNWSGIRAENIQNCINICRNTFNRLSGFSKCPCRCFCRCWCIFADQCVWVWSVRSLHCSLFLDEDQTHIVNVRIMQVYCDSAVCCVWSHPSLFLSPPAFLLLHQSCISSSGINTLKQRALLFFVCLQPHHNVHFKTETHRVNPVEIICTQKHQHSLTDIDQ